MIPWIHHKASKALAACDYVGESLANFVGITGPKYRYEIEEAQRMKEEEEKEQKEIDIEMQGWRNQTTDEGNKPVIGHPPNSNTSIVPSPLNENQIFEQH